MKKIAIILFSFAFLVACNNEKNEKKALDLPESTSIATSNTLSPIESASLGGGNMPTSYVSESAPAQPAVATSSGAGRINPPHGEPGHLCEYEVGAWIPEAGSTAQPAVASATSAGRINPPHGEPGHLCEYEVGALIPAEAAPALPAGGRINPPHGEPGHLCEYEVGAVIPAQASAGSLPQPVQTQNAANRPVPITPSMTSTLARPINTVVPTGPKPEFNPEHGRPWHDCAIPVGAPLK